MARWQLLSRSHQSRFPFPGTPARAHGRRQHPCAPAAAVPGSHILRSLRTLNHICAMCRHTTNVRALRGVVLRPWRRRARPACGHAQAMGRFLWCARPTSLCVFTHSTHLEGRRTTHTCSSLLAFLAFLARARSHFGMLRLWLRANGGPRRPFGSLRILLKLIHSEHIQSGPHLHCGARAVEHVPRCECEELAAAAPPLLAASASHTRSIEAQAAIPFRAPGCACRRALACLRLLILTS